MGTILNPKADNGSENLFLKLFNNRKNGAFADKTDFISETIDRLDSPRKLILFARPPRFGKTVMAEMLACYYSKGSDCKNVFSGLKVSGYAGTEGFRGRKRKITYEEHLNKRNVIYWDMNSIDHDFRACKSDGSLPADYADDIVDYLQYVTLLELRQNREFDEKIRKASMIGRKSLKRALAATEAKFVLIMDDWDLIFRKYRDDEVLQKKFMDMLVGLFKASSGLSCFSLAYLTGVLPIKKDDSQSGLNNFDEYSMLTPGQFVPWFGFTEEDVAEICRLPGCSVPQEDLREWHGGYKIRMFDKNLGDYRDANVYCPVSVSRAVSENQCSAYWSNSFADEEASRLINMDFAGLRDDIINLISGSSVLFDYLTFQNDMTSIDNKDQVFSLLVCLGYLGCGKLANAGDDSYAYVPNREIRETLIDIVKGQPWYSSLPVVDRSEKLFQAISSLDAAKTAEIMGSIHNSPDAAAIGYNREDSLAFCLMSGFIWGAENSYDSFRELPAGKGFADLVFVPKSRPNLPIIIAEFRRDCSPEDALNHLKEQDYAAKYRKDGDERDVLLIGLSYSSKTKEHQCRIEKM
ncbi:AAA family ATPase [Succinimonas sp.]|uniref:AAA family ATPase n=1 Tax=Succinimonas sp. TaxID=1936151 RepID=UPI003870D3B8